MIATDRRTVHANCDHAATKVARAACRRAGRSAWTPIERGDIVKGDAIRVTTEVDQVEGTLLGWGTKRLVVRDAEGAQRIFPTGDITATEAPAI